MSTRIVSLRADNFKRLRAVDITPTGEIVEISGRNAQGKSSVLDAIQAAIGGGRAIPSEPVRRGAKRGEIVLDLGDIVVKRSMTAAGGNALKVTAKDGSEIKSPQTVLDRLFGALTFDPVAFCRMKPAEQVSALRRCAGLEEAFADLDKRKVDAETRRRDFGRDVDSLKTKLQLVPDVEAGDVEINASEVVARYQRAKDGNDQNTKLREWFANLGKIAAERATRVERLTKELEAATTALAEVRKEIDDARPEVESLVDLSLVAIQEELAGLEEKNRLVRQRRSHAEIRTQLEIAETRWREQGRALEDIAEQRERMMSESKLPIKGLRFGDDGLTLNGVPFEQASSSEKIRVSATLGLAQSDGLRVMLIRDGSLLDDDAMKELAEIARRYEAQIWIEVVADPSEGVGIVIEDGEVYRPVPSEAVSVGGAA